MPLRCRLCDATFADHVVVHARASVHWRGKSFDAREAQGKIGLRVMDALGLDASDSGAMDRFLEATHIEGFREDPLGVEPWEGEKDREEGEDWEFHVGFQDPLDPGEREAAAEAAAEAVASHGNFEEAKATVGGEAVEEVRPDTDEAEDGGDETVGSWSHPDLDGD